MCTTREKLFHALGRALIYTMILLVMAVVGIVMVAAFLANGYEDPQLAACAVVTFLMFGDYITGTAKAIKTKTFKSSKMREGLWHKFSIGAILVVCWLIYRYYGVLQLPETFSLFLPGFHTAFAVMEVASILENLGGMNPDLKKLAIWKTFKSTVEEETKKK